MKLPVQRPPDANWLASTSSANWVVGLKYSVVSTRIPGAVPGCSFQATSPRTLASVATEAEVLAGAMGGELRSELGMSPQNPIAGVFTAELICGRGIAPLEQLDRAAG